MFNYLWPLLLVILSNTVYHLAAKSTPANANAFLSVFVTYIVGAVITLILYFVTGHHSIVTDFKALNWSSYLLGFAIIGLEAGWIYVYRAGWKISMGTITANITLAVILLIIGALVYKEQISLKQIIGSVLCLAGLIVMNI